MLRPSVLALLSAALAATAAILFAGGAARICARRSSAATRHLAWFAGLLATLVLTAGSLVEMPSLIRVPAIGLPLLDMSSVPSGPPSHETAGQMSARRARLRPLIARLPELDTGPMPAVLRAVVAIWAIGAVLVGLRLAASYWVATGLRRRSEALPSSCLNHAWRGARVPFAPRVRVSRELTSPATIGLFQPTILLPPSAATWDATTLDAVFAHEHAHVHRRDGVTDLIASLAGVVHWYNPLVWWARREMRLERERACDDIVLASGVSPVAYAERLLAAAAGWSAPPTAAVLFFACSTELESRLRSILDAGQRRAGMRRWSTAAVLAGSVAAAVVIAGIDLDTAHAARAGATVARSGANRIPQAPVSGTTRLPSPEPDQLRDSVAPPESERLPALGPAGERASRDALLAQYEQGPDSVLATILAGEMLRRPTDHVDLVPARAAWALSVGRRGRLVEPLADALSAHDWRVRAYAAWTLGVAGPAARRDGRVVPLLVEALSHPVWRVRAAAASALRFVGDTTALPAMRYALGDAAWQARVPAVEFVEERGGRDAVVDLRPMLRDRHGMVRARAEAALAHVSPP